MKISTAQWTSVGVVAMALGLCGCASTNPRQAAIRVQLQNNATKVYDARTGEIPPAPAHPADAYGAEQYLVPDNGSAQPIIHQPQVMIIGETAHQDPNNPDVYEGPRTDYVVVRNWHWNEDALRRGADLQIPDANGQRGIQDLTVVTPNGVNAQPTPANNPAPQQTNETATTENTTANETGGNALVGAPSNNLSGTAPKKQSAAKPQPKKPVPPANTNKLEVVGSSTAPTAFAAFLKMEGKNYYSLRKDLRTMGLPDKADYDRATRELGPSECLGYLPSYGWVSFKVKTWNDLTDNERQRWLNDSRYLAFAATFAKEEQAELKHEAQQAETQSLEDTRPAGGHAPTVINVPATDIENGNVSPQ